MGFLARMKKTLAALCCCIRKDKELDNDDGTVHQPGAERDWPVATVAVKSISCPNLAAAPITSRTQPVDSINGNVWIYNILCFECCNISSNYWLESRPRTFLDDLDVVMYWCDYCGRCTQRDTFIENIKARFV